jgi:hypothetical protein
MAWPDVYLFGSPIGPVHDWFAWHPVRLWYGKWVWLRTVRRARITTKAHLPGPMWERWTYEARK